ncbi:hypothetical protein H8959_021951 [Pygathrix nigripes]
MRTPRFASQHCYEDTQALLKALAGPPGPALGECLSIPRQLHAAVAVSRPNRVPPSRGEVITPGPPDAAARGNGAGRWAGRGCPNPTGLVSWRPRKSRRGQHAGTTSRRERAREEPGPARTRGPGAAPGLRTSRGPPGRQIRDPPGLGSWAERARRGLGPQGGEAPTATEDPGGESWGRSGTAPGTLREGPLARLCGAGGSGEEIPAGLTLQSGQRHAARPAQSRTQAARGAHAGRAALPQRPALEAEARRLPGQDREAGAAVAGGRAGAFSRAWRAGPREGTAAAKLDGLVKLRTAREAPSECVCPPGMLRSLLSDFLVRYSARHAAGLRVLTEGLEPSVCGEKLGLGQQTQVAAGRAVARWVLKPTPGECPVAWPPPCCEH